MKILFEIIKFKKHILHKNNLNNLPNSVEDDTKLVETDNCLSLSHNISEESQENQSVALVPEQQKSLTVASNNTNLVHWSPSMQSLLEEPPSNLPQQLILGGIIFGLTFFVWCWFGEIEKIGKAQGKLVPQGETYKIETLESAKISHIAVQEGEEIAAGQLIAKLNSEQELREVKRLEELLVSYREELSQNLNLLDKAEIEAKTQQLIAQAETRAKRLEIETAISKSGVTNKRLVQKQSELQAHISRKGKTDQLSKLDNAKNAQINSELQEHQQRLKKLKLLGQEGAISQELIFQAQQAQRQIEQQLIDSKLQGISNIDEQIFQSEQSLRTLKSDITQNQGELNLAQKEIERLEVDLEQKLAENQNIELAAQQKKQHHELEINQIKSKILQTENLLLTAQNLLKKRLLRSPVAGTVLAFNVRNTGKVVQSGETLAEIAPHDSPLVLSAVIPDRDAGFVEPGMTANVKFDAYSYQEYGVIPGTVVEISPNSQLDENLGSVYNIKIKLDRNYISDQSKKIFFKPGLSGSADIVIRRLSIFDVLLEPIKKLKEDGINL